MKGLAPVSSTKERLKRARFSNMRQELLAPASAIMGYAEMLMEEARGQDIGDAAPDLERIATSSRDLLALIDRFLGDGKITDEPEADDLAAMQAKLRHDLRNPLNAIKGYGELLLEDIDDLGAQVLRRDLEVLLAEAERLLSQIDVIVDFTSRNGAADTEAGGAAAGMVAELVRTIRPIERSDERAHETGRVLVVDDNESNRTLLVRRLTRDGHAVTEADGGRTALTLLESDEVDLILLDLLMPDMNGFQVLERLKSDARWREIPVIMISGLTEMDGVIRCIEAGAEEYLPKPINPVLLNARINACLERKQWRDREQQYLRELQAEKEKSEALLLNILPAQIVGRLNSGETLIADRFDDVTVLFADLVGFTAISSRLTAAHLVERLNQVFSEFDALAHRLGVEKVKTIGDAYMVAAGLPEWRADHSAAAADMALGMITILERVNTTMEFPWRARIGLHSGPAVAGIIGTHKFVYDVWGDTVNLASRFEESSAPNRIHVSEAIARTLADDFDFEARGTVELKGKGALEAYYLTGRKAARVAT
jgi:class 3 adenylate cyclase